MEPISITFFDLNQDCFTQELSLASDKRSLIIQSIPLEATPTNVVKIDEIEPIGVSIIGNTLHFLDSIKFDQNNLPNITTQFFIEKNADGSYKNGPHLSISSPVEIGPNQKEFSLIGEDDLRIGGLVFNSKESNILESVAQFNIRYVQENGLEFIEIQM